MTNHPYTSAPKPGEQGFQTTHGMSKSPEYRTWAAMRNRCHLPGSTGFHKYGGRGIKVCDEWRKSFEAFYRDMGPRPSPEYSIERGDNDGPYAPWNCQWALRDVQAYNKRNTVLVTHAGKTMNLRGWAAETGIPYRTIKSRYVQGQPPERMFSRATLVRAHTDFNRGERSSVAKLTADGVREIRRLRAAGMKMKDIGARFGVAVTTVDSILKGRNWAWLD